MHCDRLADDETIADELTDGLTGVGVGDLVDLVGVEPDLALTTANHGGGEALLSGEIDPGGKNRMSVLRFRLSSCVHVSSVSC